MPYLVQAASVIVTALISYIAKHSDIYLDKIFGMVGNIISNKVGNTAAIIVQTDPNIAVEFDVGNKEIIKKISDEHGYAEFKENLKKGSKIKITAYGTGYIQDSIEMVIDRESVSYCVILKLKKRKSSKKEG